VFFIRSVDLRANLTSAAENATGQTAKTPQIPQNIGKQGQNVQKTSGFSTKIGRNGQPANFAATLGVLTAANFASFYSVPLSQVSRTLPRAGNELPVSYTRVACSW
jgi:hypothetical protein